jgi:hypothetical protein
LPDRICPAGQREASSNTLISITAAMIKIKHPAAGQFAN